MKHTDGIASPTTTLNHIIECGDSNPSNPCVGGDLIPSYFSIRFPEKTMTDPHLKMISTTLVDDMAPVPLSIFRSNSKFDENSKHSSAKYTWPITTIFCTLSWRVQNIVVIGRVDSKLERSEFSSNFEFDRNMLSGTGARTLIWKKYTRISPARFD